MECVLCTCLGARKHCADELFYSHYLLSTEFLRNQGGTPLRWDDARKLLDWHSLCCLCITVNF